VPAGRDVVITFLEIVSSRTFRDGEENGMVQVAACKQFSMFAKWSTDRHHYMSELVVSP
jgi:hypothetical protein